MTVPNIRLIRPRKIKALYLALFLVGALWVTIRLLETNAIGQTPPPPQPTPTVNSAIIPAPVQGGISGVGFSGGMNPNLLLNSRPRTAFNFIIKPDMPIKELLPIAPKTKAHAGPLFVEDLSQVPEVSFQEPLAKTPDALQYTAHTMAKINHLNRKKTDGFMEALVSQRPDLAGLPIAMGDSCRTKGDRSQFFTQALNLIKQAKGMGGVGGVNQIINITNTAATAIEVRQAPPPASPPQPAQSGGGNFGSGGGPLPTPEEKQQVILDGKLVTAFGNFVPAQQNVDPDTFWENFGKLCAQADKANNKLDPAQCEHVTTARIAALMQVMAPESVVMRKGLVKFLVGTSHVEATRALARLAIFSAEDEIRNPAIEGLKVRREKDYSEFLLKGLRYPLPAVAKRATEAMVKLERADMVNELVNFLEEPNPRAPSMKENCCGTVQVVRELVRINHHRNCLMCHAPAVQNEVSPLVTTAEVPRPDQPLPSPSEGYSNSIPDILVRLDVTYLRQDFLQLQPVADANPWPEMQRFDFLVRTRVLSDEEAKAFPMAKAGTLSPYQRYTLAALRELTGRDTNPTPEAWRKLLDLPGRTAAH